jgi:hypothetical protein
LITEISYLKNVLDLNGKSIGISFERVPNLNDIKRFLDLANYLDAYLLNNGKTIIDEKVIESLE